MAHRGVAQLAQLVVVAHASGEGVFGVPLTLRIGQRQRGELLGSRQTRVP